MNKLRDWVRRQLLRLSAKTVLITKVYNAVIPQGVQNNNLY